MNLKNNVRYYNNINIYFRTRVSLKKFCKADYDLYGNRIMGFKAGTK